MLKVKGKEKILRAAREKSHVTNKGTPIKLIADISAETMEARRMWDTIFNVLKEKK